MPLELRGYTAHIRCDDRELESYDVHTGDDKTISCWIPSEEGKAFTVHWSGPSASTIMQVSTLMDGRQVHKRAHNKVRDGCCEGAHETASSKRPFVFAPLVLTDDDSLLHSNVTEDLGTIRVEMRRVARFSYSGYTRPVPRNVPELGPVHERSKKAGVHAISFGPPRAVKKTRSCEAHGMDDEPFAVFQFRYRPLELLQANGIVPLPGKPAMPNKRAADHMGTLDRAGPSGHKRRRIEQEVAVKPEATDDADDEDVDDMQFLEEQLAMMQRRVEQARAARQAKNAVKREMSPIRIPSSATHEVIDLT